MNFFKRKSRRTTLTISDQTKSSKASLSSGDGKASQQGSTGNLRKTNKDYHTAETIEFKENNAIKNSSKLPQRIKQTRFSDDTNENNNSSAITNGHDFDNNNEAPYLGSPRQRDNNMPLLAHPVPNLVQDNSADDNSGTPMSLYASVIKGDKAELKKIVSANPELLDTADNFGRTPLMYCVLADRLDCAKFLINMGCNLDQVDNAGRSAIHSAAHKGSYKFLELLHNRGASLDIKDNDGQTALHLATRIRTPKCLEFLLRNLGPGMVDVPDNQMRTALHWGAAFNNTECVKLLIKYGINIAIPDGDGKTPLHWAANNHDPSAVHTMAALLERSPGVLNWQDYEGRTALHFAVADGNSAAVEFLVNFETVEYSEPYICDVDRSDNTFRTPLHWAAQLGHTHIVRLLLQGIDKIAKKKVEESTENKSKSEGSRDGDEKNLKNISSDGNGATPFLYAALSDHHSVVEAMIVHDPTVTEQEDIEARNALMWAAGKGSNNVIRILLGMKKTIHTENPTDLSAKQASGKVENRKATLKFSPIDIDKQDRNGNTALHVAAWNGHGSSVELLLSQGARHDKTNSVAHTPIFGACEKGHLNVVKYLLDYNASIDLVDSESRTPLHWAALGGHAEICELLIKEGLHVDVRDTLDRTPLHCAAFGGFINCMNLLLENGANVDLQDQEGRSALHWAAQSGHLDATKLLFQYAVFPNPMEYTEERLTPLDHALQKEKEDVLQYLIEQGALSAEHIRNIAATKVQAYFRGYQVRKTFPKEILMKMLILRKEKKKEMEERSAEQIRNNAAIKIQAQFRGYQARKSRNIKTKNESQTQEEEADLKEDPKKQNDGEFLTKNEADSGSHSPDNLSLPEIMSNSTSFITQQPISTDMNNPPSHDEGVICDQISVASSSHSSLHSTPKIKLKTLEGEIREENEGLAKQHADDQKTQSLKEQKSQVMEDENIENTQKSNEKKKHRKTRKTRAQLSTRPEVSDTDSSKDKSRSPRTRKSSSPLLSLRGSSTSSVHNKNTPAVKPNSTSKERNPVPPNKPNKKEHRRRRNTKPNIDRGTPDYSALDKIGDENNIQSQTVKGIAYRSQPQDNSFFNDEMPSVPDCPVASPSASLNMSEYIESLMKMSAKERKLLVEHQNKRKEAFKCAQHSARIIQRAWLRYLQAENPTLYRKFQFNKRKTPVETKIVKVKADTLENDTSKKDPTSGVVTNDSPKQESSSSIKSALKQPSVESSVGATSVASFAQNRNSRSEGSRSSILSSSDARSSGSRIRKSSKTRRPKTVGYPDSNVYISVEKLEELSRIYGTSLPSINSSPTKSASSSKRSTISMSESIRQRFEADLQGPIPTHSPRTWASSSNVQKNRTTDTPMATRTHPRSKSGPPNKNIDLRLLPLQWQRLYGELQNANAADDARRKYSTRFSYNMDQ
ncbi:uncharacterized protein LOC120341845 isoform X2 [Styela clava]